MEYVRLGKLVDLKQGLAINSHTNHLVCDYETSLALLRIADMPTKRKVVFMDENTPDRYIAKEDDIIYTRTGQVGLVFTGQKGVVHNNCFRVIPIDEQTLSRKYLFWVLCLPEIYSMANIYAAGAAQPDLPHTSFKKIKIPICSLPIQNKIASILSAYDNLIEANSRRIKILEQMAENLYKEWFVRFRFPNYQNTPIENGIPKGWKVERYKEMLTIKYGKGLETTKLTSTGYPVFGSNGIIGFYTKYMYEKPQVLISCRGASSGVVNISLPYSFITSNSLICERTNPNLLTFEYLKYCFLNSNLVQYQTGSAQPQITINNIEKLKFVVPNIELQEEFARLVRRIDDEILTLQLQSANLTRQRDLLLPRLMSGQLTPLSNQ